jgi:hypothetical protein
LQQVDFVARKRAATPDGEPLQADGADCDPVERHDLVSELGQHAADLAFLALGQHQLQQRGLALTADKASPLGTNFSVREPDAFGQFGQDLAARIAGHERAIELLNAVARVSEPVRELAIVGENHQSRAVLVQPAYGIHPLRYLGEKVDHTRPSRGIEIGRDITLGLVDGIIDH